MIYNLAKSIEERAKYLNELSNLYPFEVYRGEFPLSLTLKERLIQKMNEAFKKELNKEIRKVKKQIKYRTDKL